MEITFNMQHAYDTTGMLLHQRETKWPTSMLVMSVYYHPTRKKTLRGIYFFLLILLIGDRNMEVFPYPNKIDVDSQKQLDLNAFNANNL